MPLRWKKKVVLAKKEVTYGTDSVPVVGTDAMLVRNVSFRPLQLQYDDRDYDVPYFGNKGRIIGAQWSELAFEVEAAGGGAAGTAPKWGVLHQGCGMSETINVGVSAVYAPVSANESSLTFYWRMDGREHKLLGAMGNVELRIAAGRIPVWAYSFIGLHVQPTDVALGTPTLTAFQKPLAVNKANTTPFTLHGFAGKFREMSIQTGNVIPYRNLPNSEAVRFVDRNARGSVRMEDELIATKDWWTIVKNGTLGALNFVHGATAGNIITVAAANVQITEPDISTEDSLAMLGCAMELQPSAAGNDEFSITVT